MVTATHLQELLSLARQGGGSANGDGGSDGAGTTQTVSDYHVTAAVPYVEGLTLMYGRSTIDFAAAGENDDVYHNGHILYSSGPVSVGYRMGTYEDGSDNPNAHEWKLMLSHLVNDELSVSFATQDKTYDTPATTTNDVTETADAINASYTMGAMTFRGTIGEADNAGGVTSTTDEHMELSMVLSF